MGSESRGRTGPGDRYIARPDAEAPASTDTFDAYASDLSELSELLDDTRGHTATRATDTATEPQDPGSRDG